ncbi:hypothetical protein H2200_007924 [Cladophialophora chaetospira]|uniref:Uncharacterized protein n=1 Tax=Cladophialophora chaetospira TaxID=386627 RepID=A0AA38X6N2_9EURO|nr:hypothetical protein H2200_007924 [Cladophialophora chaetospira]
MASGYVATILLLSGLLSRLAVALPTNGSDSLAGNICAWDADTFPVLYHEYGNDVCPPKWHLKDSGDCEDHVEGWFLDKQECSTYCEMKTTFYWGQEQPYVAVPPCKGTGSFSISESTHQGYVLKAKINVGAGKCAKIINGGITVGVGGKDGISQSWKKTVSLKENQCGYFTFIPIFRDSCGTYTDQYTYSGSTSPCIVVESIPNACTTTLVKFKRNDKIDQWRYIRGAVIFVYVDCDTLQPLKDGQDASWYHDGVPLPRGTPQMQGYEALWKEAMSKPLLAQSDDDIFGAVCRPDLGQLNATECLSVLNNIYSNAALPVFVPTKGAKAGTGVEISAVPPAHCHVYLSYDEDWDDDCKVSLMEVAAAAQKIFDSKCFDNDADTLNGNRIVRGKGNCASTVWFLREDTTPSGIAPPS